MSFNPGSIKRIAGDDLTILNEDLKQLVTQYEKDLPEDCFITDNKTMSSSNSPTRTIRRLAWSGEGSGSSFDAVLVKAVLPRTRGIADFIVTWEDGDTHTGLRVVNGVVTQHEVVHALGAVIP